jgi:hypothetical protein
MLEYLGKEISGITGIFIQGAAGDINPRFVGGLDGYIDDIKKTEELGYEIGKEVARVYTDITSQSLTAQIILVHKDITCPKKYAAIA